MANDRLHLLALALICLSSTGCVRHGVDMRAVAKTEPETEAKPGQHTYQALSEDRWQQQWQGEKIVTHGLPASRRMTVFRIDQDDVFYRADAVVRSPLPWWQRFPADVVSDLLWPGDLPVEGHWQPRMQAVPTSTIDELRSQAAAHGYADQPKQKQQKMPKMADPASRVKE